MSKRTKQLRQNPNRQDKKNNYIFVVTDEGEFDKIFSNESDAQDYVDTLDDEYDTGSWNIIKVPIKEALQAIKKV